MQVGPIRQARRLRGHLSQRMIVLIALFVAVVPVALIALASGAAPTALIAVAGLSMAAAALTLRAAITGTDPDQRADHAAGSAATAAARAMRDRNILLKDVHHRIKNNLQLISSIMNMQIRNAKERETRRVLGRVRDRVLGLATVHHALYGNDDIGRTNARSLLDDLCAKMFESTTAPAGLKMQQDFDDLHMLPDQAVPLALLTGELLTNALNYAIAQPDRENRINLEFKVQKDGQARLRCKNTIDSPDDIAAMQQDVGFGRKLVQAFSAQLDAEPVVVITERSYCVDVAFNVARATPGPADF